MDCCVQTMPQTRFARNPGSFLFVFDPARPHCHVLSVALKGNTCLSRIHPTSVAPKCTALQGFSISVKFMASKVSCEAALKCLMATTLLYLVKSCTALTLPSQCFNSQLRLRLPDTYVPAYLSLLFSTKPFSFSI